MLVRDLIRNARIQWQQGVKDEWLYRRIIALDYYHGRTGVANPLIRLMYYKHARRYYYTEQFFTKKQLLESPIDDNNITKRVVKRISQIYTIPPVRDMDNETAQANYDEATKGKNRRMAKAERYLNLLESHVLHPRIVDRKIKIDILVDYEPVFDDDTMAPTGIHYPLRTNSSVMSTQDETWAFWYWGDKMDRVHVEYIRGTGEIVKNEPYPYERSAFVFCFKDMPETEFMDTEPAMDIIHTNLVLNVLGTVQNLNGRYQSFGWPYATGFNAKNKGEVKLGQDKLMYLPTGSDVGMLNPPDTMAGLTEMLNTKYKTLANNYHIPTAFVEGNTQAESGVALKTRNQELNEDKRGEVENWKDIEYELYPIEREILANEGIAIPETMVLDYNETKVVLTPDEQARQDEFDLKYNLISPVDILIRRNPDLPEEDAMAQIEQNKTANSNPIQEPETPTDRILGALQ